MINENYHTLSGGDIAEESRDIRYSEYRRQWHENPEKFIVNDFPLFLDIEATSACNLRCPHCVQTKANFKKGFMPLSMYKRIIDEAVDNNCYGCKYHSIGRGEPLLHRQIVQMVEYAKKRGLIDVYLNTNATLLNARMCVELLDAGLDRISFSIDGSSKRFYEERRRGADWGDVFNTVAGFKTFRDKFNYKTKIRIQTVKLKGINLIEYGTFWKSYCDEVSYIDYKEMNRRKSNVIDKDFRCPQLWQRMSILWTGEILPCNHDDRLYASLGKLGKNSIRKAWDSSALRYMRGLHKSGNSQFLAACDGCYLRDSIIDK